MALDLLHLLIDKLLACRLTVEIGPKGSIHFAPTCVSLAHRAQKVESSPFIKGMNSKGRGLIGKRTTNFVFPRHRMFSNLEASYSAKMTA